MDIYKNGIDLILDSYVKTIIQLKGLNCIKGKNKNVKINYPFFISLLKKLSENEDTNLKKFMVQKIKKENIVMQLILSKKKWII